jgi:hypothetical protein
MVLSYKLCSCRAGVVSKPAAPPAAPAPKRQQPQPWVDIDEQNKDNPLACSEYAESIFNYLNTCEVSSSGDMQQWRNSSCHEQYNCTACTPELAGNCL